MIKFFQLDEFVAVTPGYSGEYFLPFVFESQAAENALGWVPISPGEIQINSKNFQPDFRRSKEVLPRRDRLAADSNPHFVWRVRLRRRTGRTHPC